MLDKISWARMKLWSTNAKFIKRFVTGLYCLINNTFSVFCILHKRWDVCIVCAASLLTEVFACSTFSTIAIVFSASRYKLELIWIKLIHIHSILTRG